MADIRVIAKLKAMGDFPIADVEDIDFGGIRLDVVINQVRQTLTDVFTAIEENENNIRANSGKIEANTTAINDLRVDLSTAETAIASKASQEEVNTIKSDVAGKASAESVAQLQTDMSVQTARMDQLVGTVPAGSADEIADARVTADGKTEANLGNAIRSQVTSLKETIARFEENAEAKQAELVDAYNRITEFKNIEFTTESGIAITTDTGTLDAALSYVKTDKTLTDEILPANAKAVGDEIVAEADKVRSEMKRYDFNYNNYYLPVLSLVGSMDGMTKDDKKSFDYKFRDRKGTCSMKWQGASSINYPKKNFTITFDKDFEADPAWGFHKKYCLKANYIDFSHLRNIVSANIWGNIVNRRSSLKAMENIEYSEGAFTDENGNNIQWYSNPINYLKNAGSVDGFPIILVLNNQFYGLYTFNIPKDEWMFDMDKLPNENVGFFSANEHSRATQFRGELKGDNSDFEVEYCSTDDDSWLVDMLNAFINKCIDCNSNEAYNDLYHYCDMDGIIDYMVFSLLTTNLDGVDKNFLFATFDGTKFFITAYDMDSVFGMWWNGQSYVDSKYYPTLADLRRESRLFELVLTYDKAKLKSRYNDIRNTVMSEDSIMSMFYNYANKIQISVKAEDAKKWGETPNTNTSDVAQIINYYNLRAKYIDSLIENM